MQVFLSYSDADRDFARQLASQLSKRGCEVWDPSDQVFPGDNGPLKIGEALKESKAMVVLLSPDSMKSEWVRGEIQYALGSRNYEGRLFPVLVRPTRGIPWILRKFGILRAENGPQAISERIATALSTQKYPALRTLLARRKASPAELAEGVEKFQALRALLARRKSK